MFNNIGKKLKGLAKVVCWIGIVLSVLLGAMCVISGYVELNGHTVNGVIYGLFVIVLGCLASWINSWVLYAFGQITDDVHEIRNSKRD